ncbi:hypothetical protein [Mammaliicoccus sciuri]|uniref:hypothetical protein n=1 Tax=Mammaliicoccus sciuri TaxID=1296 RepID=UPI002DC02034|nr:hypothetical protein [Mammaliicoccus sciuri]MEB8265333.1 hypothetical protein [Mammaliicoccus sciuri]
MNKKKKLPCTIVDNPLKSKSKIKTIEFNKEKILEELKNNQKYITNTELGIIEIPDKKDYIYVRHLYTSNIKVHFDEK